MGGSVGNAIVTLTDTKNQNNIITCTTGSAGGCTLQNVAVGTYTVTATAENYENYARNEDLTVTIDTSSLDIVMTKI